MMFGPNGNRRKIDPHGITDFAKNLMIAFYSNQGSSADALCYKIQRMEKSDKARFYGNFDILNYYSCLTTNSISPLLL